MKKLIFTILLTTSVFSISNAQFTKLGGGVVYGTGFRYNNETGVFADLHKSPFLGIYITGVYEITLPIHVSPSFTYFIPRSNDSGVGTANESTRVSEMMFDINGHYTFNSLDRFEFYGLAGLNVTLAKIKWIGTASSDSDNAIGLNLGGGTYMKLTEQLDLNAELKYIVSKYDQLLINVGLLLNIDWLKKNENKGI